MTGRDGDAKSPIFPGFDRAVIPKHPYNPSELPLEIKLVEHKESMIVNTQSMIVHGDGGKVNIQLDRFDRYLTRGTAKAFKCAILTALDRRRKSSTVHRWLSRLHLFLSRCSERLQGRKIRTITLAMVQWETEGDGPSSVKLLRSVIRYWVKQNYCGISIDLTEHIHSTSPPKPPTPQQIQNTKPRERPLSISQTRALSAEIGEAFAKNIFNPQEYLAWLLLTSEGMRPSQIALLKLNNFEISRDEKNEVTQVIIYIPMVKQKASPASDNLIPQPLPPRVWPALFSHLAFLEEVLGRKPSAVQSLFCVAQKFFKQKYFVQSSPLNISTLIGRSRKKLPNIIDGVESADIFSRRIKSTRLTQLGMLGATIAMLQIFAHHSSAGSLRRYVKLSPEVQEDVENRMSADHTILVNFFKGTIVSREDATHKDEEHRIGGPDLSDNDLGSCSLTPCKSFQNVGCYGCFKFEAFSDGDHESALSWLKARRKEREDAGLEESVVTLQDDLIAAVEQVIKDAAKIQEKA